MLQLRNFKYSLLYLQNKRVFLLIGLFFCCCCLFSLPTILFFLAGMDSCSKRPVHTSRLPGFHRLSPQQRVSLLQSSLELTDDACSALQRCDMATSSLMSENVIGMLALPIGVATNFRVNGEDVLVPMVIEEASVVAAASNMAKACLPGGFHASGAHNGAMIGQIHLQNVPDIASALVAIATRKAEIMDLANSMDGPLVAHGGGCKDVVCRVVSLDAVSSSSSCFFSASSPKITAPVTTTNVIDSRNNTRTTASVDSSALEHVIVIVHLLVDCMDAMGANAVNTMVEKVSPMIAELTKGDCLMRIVSNLADQRLVTASAEWPAENLGGEGVVDRIIMANRVAQTDPYRAATHRKGIMNGIDAVVLATGNDWRAVEAGAHAFAVMPGSPSKTLTVYEKTEQGNLRGSITLPLAVGTVGGASRNNPAYRTCLAIMKVPSVGGSAQLAKIIAAVGLCQNVAALRALVTEGAAFLFFVLDSFTYLYILNLKMHLILNMRT